MRLNRHGQPAVGLSGDDGQLFRVATMEGPGRRGHRPRGADRARRRDRHPPHRRGLHPGDRLRRRRPPRAARTTSTPTRPRAPSRAPPAPTRSCSSRTSRAGCAIRPTRRRSSPSAAPTRSRPRCAVDLGRDAAEAAGLHRRDPRRRLVRAHHRRPPAALAAARAVHRRRRRHEGPAGVVSALAPTYARYPVEFASGSGCVLTDADGRRVPRLPGRDRGLLARALRTRRSSRAVQEQAARLMHVSNLFTNAPMVRLAERLVERSFGRERVLRQLGRGGQRGGAEARAQGAAAGRRRRPSTARSTGAPTARCRRRRRSPSRRRSRRWCPASGPSSRPPRRSPATVDEHTAAVLLEPVQGESGVHPLAPEVLRRRARGVRPRRRRARVRRGPVRRGADRLAVGLRAGGRRARRDDARQGPRRRDADRRARDRPERSPASSRPGDHGSTFAGGPVSAAAANAVLDVVDDPDFLAGVHERGERLAEGLKELPGVTDVRARGLMVAADIAADAPDVARRALLEQHLVINATGPAHAALRPAADGHRGRDRHRARSASTRCSEPRRQRRRGSSGASVRAADEPARVESAHPSSAGSTVGHRARPIATSGGRRVEPLPY